VDTSLLAQELEPLNAQIEQTRKELDALEDQLRVLEKELEKFSAARKRFDALRDVCDALDKLGELKAGELFWKGITEVEDAAGYLEEVRSRVARFDEKIRGRLERQTSLQAQINRHLEELDYLYEEVRDAYDREERRKEEFVVERTISPVPYRAMIMPWTREAESEQYFRRALLAALLICFFFGTLIPLIGVPIPDRSVEVGEIPKRLAMLVKKEPPKPAPQPNPVLPQPQEEPRKAQEKAKKPKKESKKVQKEAKKPKKQSRKVQEETKSRPEPKKPNELHKKKAPEQTRVAAGGGGGAPAARKKAERVGILAFKKTFAGLMDETPIAKLGTEARLRKDSPRVAGQAVAQRSLVAMQAQDGSSGGIGNAGISRNIGRGNVDRGGGSGIGRGGGSGSGVGFARVESSIANLEESSRPLSDGPSPGRTDEEIQIVFDRYKATLYRIYNRELRKDPTLRGKMLLRICIETSGAVSMCEVEFTDLASPELVAKIVERIKRFNFGPKEGVPKMIILYPIDFLPAA
jgi:hypothetical protein